MQRAGKVQENFHRVRCIETVKHGTQVFGVKFVFRVELSGFACTLLLSGTESAGQEFQPHRERF